MASSIPFGFSEFEDEVYFDRMYFPGGKRPEFFLKGGDDIIDLTTDDSGAVALETGIYCGAQNDIAVGTAGADYILGDADSALPMLIVDDAAAQLDDGDDALEGAAGSDTIYGMRGADFVSGGDGDDTLGGGDGFDTISFATNSSAVDIDLLANPFGRGRSTSETGNDVFSGFEIVLGSRFDDTISGNGSDDVIAGGDGHDEIRGRGGKDNLDGMDGNDTLTGRGGESVLTGGAGDDVIEISGGRHAADGGVGRDLFVLEQDVTVPSEFEPRRNAHDVYDDTIMGGAGADALEVDFSYAAMIGVPISQTVEFDGGAGSDVLRLEIARDAVEVTADGDWLRLRHDTGVALANGAGTAVIDVSLKDVEFVNFDGEKVSVADLTRTEPDIELSNDEIVENASPGAFVGKLSASGLDRASVKFAETPYSNSQYFEIIGDEIRVSAHVKLDFELIQAERMWIEATDASGKSIIEELNLTVRGMVEPTNVRVDSNASNRIAGTAINDEITGNGGDDTIRGLSGDDYIRGGSGNDFISGDSGDDRLDGVKGRDTLQGGAGRDAFVFSSPLSNGAADVIRDFAVADDQFLLDIDQFWQVGESLSHSEFRQGPKALDADDRIIYHARTGRLLYDEDGSGASKAIQFAQVDAKTAITHDDFIVYL